MTKPTGDRELGARLRELRNEKGLKLAVIADRSGVSLAYVSEVERGRKLPSLDILSRLAGALEMSVSDVLRGVESYNRINQRRAGHRS